MIQLIMLASYHPSPQAHQSEVGLGDFVWFAESQAKRG